MSLQDIVDISITAGTTTVSRAGFGIPIVFALNVPVGFPVSRSYASAAAMLTDNFTANDPAYLAVTSVLSQNPSVKEVKVARRSGTLTYSATHTLGTPSGVPAAGTVFGGAVRGPDGVITAFTETADGVDTFDVVAATLSALIDAVTDLTSSATLNVITNTADNTNEIFFFDGMTTNLGYLDTSSGASTELAADYATAADFDSDFYGILLDTQSDVDNAAMSAVIEATRKIFFANTTDAGCLDIGTSSDIMSTLQASALARTAVSYSADQSGYLSHGWVGDRFPSDPGSSTWKFKTVNGVAADPLTTSEQASIISKGGNMNIRIAGNNIMCNGTVAEGEFIDTVRFIDWLVSRIEEDEFTLLLNAPKVKFTDAGIDQVVGVLSARLENGIDVGGLAAEPKFIITAPTKAEIPTADVAARRLTGIKFTAPLAGAVHAIEINGVLGV